jgi:hypothetical protein
MDYVIRDDSFPYEIASVVARLLAKEPIDTRMKKRIHHGVPIAIATPPAFLTGLAHGAVRHIFRRLRPLCFALFASSAAYGDEVPAPDTPPVAAASDIRTVDQDRSTARLTQGAIATFCSSVPPSKYDGRKNPKIPFKDVCFDQKIIPSSKATYFQALKQLFPDLKDDGKGHATQVRDRRSEIKADKLWLNDSGQYDLDLGTAGNYLLIEEKDQTQLVLFFEDLGFLALYSIKPRFKLVDFIDVQQDQHSSLLIMQPYDVLPVKPGVWLFPISNWHDNSSQSYDNNLLFLTLDGKLRLAYDGPDLLNTRDSKHYECVEAESLAELKLLETQHDQFSDISLKLNRVRSCDIEDKKTGQTTRKTIREKVYPATLYWDPQKRKYMGGSQEFVRDHKKG